ncbi:MAG: alanine--tRNA ligase [Patescibacteria group bacterium]
MTSAELRKKYLDFFKSKGHAIIPSAPLVPANDPTVLFTTAGMHPLVPYLLGEQHPGGKRVTSAQKCIRTGDIEEVGDNVHLTFFEMLGNWSFGDYFKQEAIEWSWEFLTDKKWLGINPDQLAFSVFEGDKDAPRDEESAAIWKSLGAKPERLAYLPKADNWWGPAGETGPCGPDTEMFYWTGSKDAMPEKFDPEDGAWVEIWNDVFMQYNKTAAGKFETLKQRNVDTGMGLDRVLAVLNGHASVYDTELFTPMFEVVGKSQPLTSNDEIKKIRIVLDHVRASVFIVADGVEPSNKDRGYVLRRLLRRSLVHGRLLGLRPNWLKALVGKVIEIYHETYHELVDDSEKIFGVILEEEKKFGKTLEKGLREFEKIMRSKSPDDTRISGTDAFNLYQSYGFPWELTSELAEQSGQKIARKEFEKEFKKHQELSRTASAGRFKGGLADHTEKIVRLHTATHLLNVGLRQVLGGEVWQKGSNITEERTRFDFTHPKKLTDEEKQKVEELVNGWIGADLPVKKEILSLEDARKLGAIGVFGEKYPDTVSVYSIVDPKTGDVISREFCGGPHVERTGVIGRFKIIKEEAISAGVRRIKAVVT